MDKLEEISFDECRTMINKIATHGNEYAGMPMPIDDEQLIIHPSYRFANLYKTEPKVESEELRECVVHDDFKFINSWWSSKRGMEYILFSEDGKIKWTISERVNQALLQMRTMGVADAWGLDAEIKAMEKLGELLSERSHAMRKYILTGAFLESSKKSGVTYMFRRLRPTLAISTRSEEPKILCALCLHPIGYYADSWAGVMCPTDEVIAHLMLMRGDEHDFWKQANQHPAHRPEAGI